MLNGIHIVGLVSSSSSLFIIFKCDFQNSEIHDFKDAYMYKVHTF